MTEPPLTLTDAAAALRSGATTSAALTEEALRRADALDERLGVYVTRFDDYAMQRAEAADAALAAGDDLGPLHGIPIGVKDILAMAEGPTTGQSLILDPAWGADKDAPVVERLKAAGAVITGKASTMEFAIGMPDTDKPFPVPRNPWDEQTWPGGSSSGTGAGVAGGLFYAGIGTDTGGSIRIPAAYCGVSGLMPTFGRVPNAGCVPLGYSLDHIGPLARSARDCAVMLQAFAGYDERCSTTADEPVPDFTGLASGTLEGFRIGVVRADHFGADGEDPAARRVFEDAVAVLADLGAEPVEVVLPLYQETNAAQMVTMLSEALAYHRDDMGSRWGDYFAATRAFVGMGAAFSGADFVQAQRVRRVTQRKLAELLSTVDALVMPTATRGAPTYEEIEAGGITGLLGTVRTLYWDAVGNPALVMPMGFGESGLPLSLQITAAPFAEATLVQVGDAYQRATDWHLRRAPLFAEAVA